MSLRIGALIVRSMNVLLEYVAAIVLILFVAAGLIFLPNFFTPLFGPNSIITPVLCGFLGLIVGLIIDIFVLGTLFLFLEINNNLIDIKNNLKISIGNKS